MKEIPSVPPSGTNGVDLSGRFIPDGDPSAGPHTFAEKVAHRAYLLFVDAGATHGHDLEHWLLAEQQIRAHASRPLKGFFSRRTT
jgi:hypothetical protein